MKARETQARAGAGGRAAAPARRLVLGVALGVVGAVVVAAPAGGGSASSAGAAPQTITASGTSFSPANVTINQGETVTWRNMGGTHNVVLEGPDGFEYPNPPAPESNTMVWPFTRTLNTPGTWRYYCRPHRNVPMEGTVTVVASSPAPNPPSPPPPAPPPGPPGSPPGTPAPGTAPSGKLATTVTLRVSDATSDRGERVRFFGSVRPERDGRFLQLQRRTRRDSYTTVTRIRLKDAGSSRSKFSKRLRVLRDAVFRARLPADGTHKAGTSRPRRVNVR